MSRSFPLQSTTRVGWLELGEGEQTVFRYNIALDIWVGGSRPVLVDDVAANLPIGAHLTITLAHAYVFNDGGAQISLPAGTVVTGVIIAKQALPPQQGGANPHAGNANP